MPRPVYGASRQHAGNVCQPMMALLADSNPPRETPEPTRQLHITVCILALGSLSVTAGAAGGSATPKKCAYWRVAFPQARDPRVNSAQGLVPLSGTSGPPADRDPPAWSAPA